MPQLLATVPALSREEAVRLGHDTCAAERAPGPSADPASPVAEHPHQLLTAEEAAHRLGISTRQLYRRADALPFTTREFGGVRFHAGRLSQYIAAQFGG